MPEVLGSVLMRQAKRRNTLQDITRVFARRSDPVSDLPDNVIQTILMKLPTRDAVRTSILSRKWRHRWTKLPKFVLDKSLWNKTSYIFSARTTVAMISCQLLLHHEGPINKFTLSVGTLERCPEIENLIFFLLRKGIEYLTLEMWRNGDYKLPLLFYTCQQLLHLSLRYCLIESTPNFNRFTRLTTLKLRDVTISTDVLNGLISSSPLLKLLDLHFIYYSRKLEIEINATNLETFSFAGVAKSIVFKKVPLLASVTIVMAGERQGEEYFKQIGKRNSLEFFHDLPVLEKLHLSCRFISFLAAGEMPKKLPTTLVNLNNLKLVEIMLDQLDGLLFALCLIRSSPNLEHIDIKFSTEKVSTRSDVLDFLEAEDFSDVELNKLKDVKVTNVSGTRPQFKLIELLIVKSPQLKKMIVQNHSGVTSAQGFKILRELSKFKGASKKAELIYTDKIENRVYSIKNI